MYDGLATSLTRRVARQTIFYTVIAPALYAEGFQSAGKVLPSTRPCRNPFIPFATSYQVFDYELFLQHPFVVALQVEESFRPSLEGERRSTLRIFVDDVPSGIHSNETRIYLATSRRFNREASPRVVW